MPKFNNAACPIVGTVGTMVSYVVWLSLTQQLDGPFYCIYLLNLLKGALRDAIGIMDFMMRVYMLDVADLCVCQE